MLGGSPSGLRRGFVGRLGMLRGRFGSTWWGRGDNVFCHCVCRRRVGLFTWNIEEIGCDARHLTKQRITHLMRLDEFKTMRSSRLDNETSFREIMLLHDCLALPDETSWSIVQR